LVGSGQVKFDRPGNYAIVGELALTGDPAGQDGGIGIISVFCVLNESIPINRVSNELTPINLLQ
jgi:hypothetical protein